MTAGNRTTSRRDAISGQGVLIIETTVSGDGTWILADPAAAIRFDADCTGLTGDVELSAGTFDINRNFKTTGDLTMDGGSITVESGKTAEFGTAP